ncbi:MAG TPA: amidohydrolase family protein [Stellaceae bacterium]|nr:amidohydrolase family protein [Stellaceae bacterium]
MTPSEKPGGPPPLANPSKPRLALPPGSCDSHCHIFGPFARHPLPPDRRFTPHEAPETALRALQQHLGLSRAVIVHSTGHGMDHAPLLDALAAGNGRYRGVAILKPTDTAAVVRRYHEAGVRGVRFNFLAHLGGRPDPNFLRAVVDLVRPFGWHLAIHVAGHDLVDYADVIAAIDVPVVIDHMARPDLREGLAGPTVLALKRLLDSGRVWVKLSGADRVTREGPPYGDAVRLARDLAAHAPERALWGSDWPHVNIDEPVPDDGKLVDLISEIALGEAPRRRMLVDNPGELFGFDKPL